MFRRIRHKILRYLIILLYFLILFICAVEINFLGLFGYSPNITEIRMPSLNTTSELYASNGELLGRYYKENRTMVTYDSISPYIIHALVATEDIRFFQHWGVDYRAIASSLAATLSGAPRGGSTITQQLAKNLYKTRYEKSKGLLGRIPGIGLLIIKVKEWMTAYKLESRYSKQDILTMYLNTVSFGNNAYGIQAASKRYFNRDPLAVNPAQAALLIGMLKGTTYYNPFRNPENALKRRNIVLSQMIKAGYLSKQDYETLLNTPLMAHQGNVEEDTSGNNAYIQAAVLRYLEPWAEENGYNIHEDGLRIYTTIDMRMQGYAEQVVARQMDRLQQRFDQQWAGKDPWRNAQGEVIPNFLEDQVEKLPFYAFLKDKFSDQPDSISYYLNKPKEMEVFTWDGMKKMSLSTVDSLEHYLRLLNTGMMAMDPNTGAIKVWVGGINHRYFKYDHVDQAKRQAGSTFKPFAYLTALEQGMSPCDMFVDRPVTIHYMEKGEAKTWEPKNADWNFTYRNMSMRWALGRSVNSITAQITEKVGWDEVVKSAHRCGIESPLAAVPSVSLGSSEVSIYEMVKAYAAFINKGYKIEPILVSKITDSEGRVIAEFTPRKKRVFTQEVAWLMSYMLRGTMEEPGGTSQALWEWDLWKNNNQIAGKTGTSSDYVDGWYMGITPQLVTGVWVGNDERSIHFNTSATGEGAHTALPIFGMFMEKLYQDPESGYTYQAFPKPETEITRPYNCPSPRIASPVREDSTTVIPEKYPIFDPNADPEIPDLDITPPKNPQP